MKANLLRYLSIEIYKTINNIDPSFMNQISQLRETNRLVQTHYKLNLSVPKVNQVMVLVMVNQVSYGEKKSEILCA